MKKTLFYIKHDLTNELLTKTSTWVRSIGDEAVAVFDNEASASASIPVGVPCHVLKITSHEKPVKHGSLSRPAKSED